MVSRTEWLGYCLRKPGAWQDEPWEGDVVAKVGDKIFAFLGDGTAIGLKCGDRETADLLLDRYRGAASKTAYIGQHGWNTFALGGLVVVPYVIPIVTFLILLAIGMNKSR